MYIFVYVYLGIKKVIKVSNENNHIGSILGADGKKVCTS